MLIYFWEICIFIRIGGKKIQRFKDIKEIYKIYGINDEYIIVKGENKTYKKYIYEIMPVTLLDFSIEVQNSIYMIYNEFLREMDLNLQIYISNKKMNTESYIKNLNDSILRENNEKFKIFLTNYLDDLKEKLNYERIYITKYYIVVSLDRKSEQNIEEIDNVFKKLNKLGCIVNRISKRKDFVNILYESINKESLM